MKYVFTISLVLIEIWFCNVNGKEIQGRIAGGNFAEKNQFPHHAAIYFGSQFICGGSIISQQIILTAGHCVEDIPVEKLKVVIGTNNLLNLNSAAFLDVEHTRKHESYSFPFNDIALMSLKKPLTFSDSVQKIEIATEDLPVGSDVIAIGFGRETTYGPPSKKLKFNDMIRVNSNKGCYDFVHDGVVCLESEVKNGPCKVSYNYYVQTSN